MTTTHVILQEGKLYPFNMSPALFDVLNFDLLTPEEQSTYGVYTVVNPSPPEFDRTFYKVDTTFTLADNEVNATHTILPAYPPRCLLRKSIKEALSKDFVRLVYKGKSYLIEIQDLYEMRWGPDEDANSLTVWNETSGKLIDLLPEDTTLVLAAFFKIKRNIKRLFNLLSGTNTRAQYDSRVTKFNEHLARFTNDECNEGVQI